MVQDRPLEFHPNGNLQYSVVNVLSPLQGVQQETCEEGETQAESRSSESLEITGLPRTRYKTREGVPLECTHKHNILTLLLTWK